MNIAKSAGMAVGLIVGILLVVVLSKAANKDHRVKTEYDERQQVIRGVAYRYAFYTIMIYEAVMIVLTLAEIELPVEDYILHFGGIVLSGLVLAVYSIWHDVYWGLNNNRTRYGVVFFITALLNLIPVIFAIKGGSFLKDGKFGSQVLNLMALVMLLILAIALLLKED